MKKYNYTKEILINEIHRFYKENGRTPVYNDFTHKSDEFKNYPETRNFVRCFGSWTNAIKEAGYKTALEKLQEDNKEIRYCKNCGKEIIKTSTKTDKHFCNHSCSAAYNNKNRIVSEITKDKIRNTINEYYSLKPKKEKQRKKSIKKPKNIEYIREFRKYRKLCNFPSLQKYYNEFNGYELYLNNPKEMHLDHIFSVKDGFDLCIHPNIISHPSNCQILNKTVNMSKGKNSHITYQELLERIIAWEINHDTWKLTKNYYESIFYKQIEKIEYSKLTLSKITGKFYNQDIESTKSWNNNARYKSAKLLSETFGFDLGDRYSEKNILNAIEILRWKYCVEGKSGDQIKKEYRIKYSTFINFIKNILEI